MLLGVREADLEHRVEVHTRHMYSGELIPVSTTARAWL